jgi:hypothetical protein
LQILRQLGVCSAMIVPLLADGRTLGRDEPGFGHAAAQLFAFRPFLAEDLARRCAMAVENARLHRKDSRCAQGAR